MNPILAPWQARRTQQAGEQLLQRMLNLGNQAVPDEYAAKNIAALRARFEAVASALKEMRFAGSGGAPRSVHELPWYAVIGAPGSGNSTTLRNSGLHFAQLATDGDAEVTGFGGTRYCEWWFAQEAVLLDTAGRYNAHEARSKEGAQAGIAAWHGFLALLKELRPRQPLNGAIVTLSVTDLLLWNKPERAHFAAYVRMRLAELYAGLDARFPVYLLVTKMDLLAGFAEFFANLDAQARAQVWGTTFDVGADPMAVSQSYAADFDLLQNRLYAEMLARLEEEPDLARRAAIYRFPQQFHALGPLLGDFLGAAFATHVGHQPLMLRGAYFTSAAQTGRPIDRVMRTLERAFRLEHFQTGMAGAEAGSYFIGDLLQKVIFPEAGLAVAGASNARGLQSPPRRIG